MILLEMQIERTRVRYLIARYVAGHPGCSARDVTANILGGNGAARSIERTRTYSHLLFLERRDVVRRDKVAPAHRWFAVDPSRWT